MKKLFIIILLILINHASYAKVSKEALRTLIISITKYNNKTISLKNNEENVFFDPVNLYFNDNGVSIHMHVNDQTKSYIELVDADKSKSQAICELITYSNSESFIKYEIKEVMNSGYTCKIDQLEPSHIIITQNRE